MKSNLRRSRRSDKGATIVEFALVMPLIALMLFGMVEFALVLSSKSAATNGAREASRLAAFDYAAADQSVPPSDNYLAIEEAAHARLAGLVKPGTVEVDVVCLDGNPPTDTPIACSPGTVVPGRDLIQVTVTWEHLSSTPFIAAEHTASSRAVIVGRPLPPTDTPADDSDEEDDGEDDEDWVPEDPTDDEPPSSCLITNAAFQGGLSSTAVKSNGRLNNDITVDVSTTSTCGGLAPTISITPANPIGTSTMTTNSSTSFSYAIGGQSKPWSAGTTYTVTILVDGVSETLTFTTT